MSMPISITAALRNLKATSNAASASVMGLAVRSRIDSVKSPAAHKLPAGDLLPPILAHCPARARAGWLQQKG